MQKEIRTRTLVRVVAPHFVAGIVVVGGRVTEAAPILSWTIGKDQDWLRGYFKRKGWEAFIIDKYVDCA